MSEYLLTCGASAISKVHCNSAYPYKLVNTVKLA